jgi:plastocyanin
MNRKLLAMALMGAALALGACGDDDGGGSDAGDTGNPEQTPTQATPAPEQESEGGQSGTQEKGGGTQLTNDADPSGQLKFQKSSLEAKAGKVTITMNNPSDLPHAIEVEGNGVEEEGETVQKGGKSVVTAELKPGEYEFYCPVPGHKEGGMTGTLTVK